MYILYYKIKRNIIEHNFKYDLAYLILGINLWKRGFIDFYIKTCLKPFFKIYSNCLHL